MNKQILLVLSLAVFSQISNGQKFFTRNGNLSIFSKTDQEDIDAKNDKVTYILDITSGQLEISGLQTNFQFQKAFMQEHYNENYMESSKFPKATFKGKIVNLADVKNFQAEGVFKAKVSGNLEIHGVSKPYNVDVTFKVGGGHIIGETKFVVKCSDHNIKIEEHLKGSISDNIDVSAKCDLVELKK
jgi:hypothetical protein